MVYKGGDFLLFVVVEWIVARECVRRIVSNFDIATAMPLTNSRLGFSSSQLFLSLIRPVYISAYPYLVLST